MNLSHLEQILGSIIFVFLKKCVFWNVLSDVKDMIV